MSQIHSFPLNSSLNQQYHLQRIQLKINWENQLLFGVQWALSSCRRYRMWKNYYGSACCWVIQKTNLHLQYELRIRCDWFNRWVQANRCETAAEESTREVCQNVRASCEYRSKQNTHWITYNLVSKQELQYTSERNDSKLRSHQAEAAEETKWRGAISEMVKTWKEIKKSQRE